MNRSFPNLAALVFLVFALLLLHPAFSHAQTFRGTILGTVTDSSGAAVPGATVVIKNVDTGLTRTVITSDDGSYSAPELPIGNYTVTVQKEGFKEGVVAGIKVDVSSERRADVALQPGQLAQNVEVVGEELPMVESTSNTLGGIVESKIVTSLPVNGRDYQKLIFLVPGVTGSPDQITDSPGAYGIFSVNGARGRSNNFLLDGTDMNDGYRNDPAINEAGVFGTPATILPIEAIAELHVASNFEAEYGRSAGGVVNVVTKSGTNLLHGSFFEFFRNNALDARNFFNDKSVEQNPFHANQFGGSLGGPIIKDKTFFFVDYEGMRETGAQATPACVPTAADITYNTPAGGVNPVIANLLAAAIAGPLLMAPVLVSAILSTDRPFPATPSWPPRSPTKSMAPSSRSITTSTKTICSPDATSSATAIRAFRWLSSAAARFPVTTPSLPLAFSWSPFPSFPCSLPPSSTKRVWVGIVSLKVFSAGSQFRSRLHWPEHRWHRRRPRHARHRRQWPSPTWRQLIDHPPSRRF